MIAAYLKDKLRMLHDIRAEPEAVAGGVAIGMFMGFTPFIGLKTLLALFIAWVARCSKMAAVITVTLHDVLLLLQPVLIWVEYLLGNWVLQRPSKKELPQLLGHFWEHWGSFFQWSFFNECIYPVIIGWIIVGLPFAVASYFLMHSVLLKMRRHREALNAAAAARGAAVDPNDI